MKKQLLIIAGLLLSFFFPSLVYSQNAKYISKTDASTNVASDSTALQSLVVKLLKWHQSDRKSDFEPLVNNSKDSVYSGINWGLHKKRMLQLEETGLFTKSFLDNYQQIALQLDKELKTNKTKYFVGDLPPYGNETSEWCNCQDYPNNFWKRLKIVNLEITGNAANFKWTAGNNFSYSIKAIKENNKWKIATLEKFTIKNFSW